MRKLDKPARGFGFATTEGGLFHREDGFTMREELCMKLGIIESGDEEIDELIRKSEQKRVSTLLLQSLVIDPKSDGMDDDELCSRAMKLASKLLNKIEQNYEI